MDRKIALKRWTLRRVLSATATTVIVGAAAYALLKDSGILQLNVDRDKLTVSVVALGPFQEYTSVRGTVLPIKTVFLDALEGGTVIVRYVEEGAIVAAGDTLLRLSNPESELAVYIEEAAMARQLDELRRGRLSMEQQVLASRSGVLRAEYDFRATERRYRRYASLHDTVRLAILARQEWERIGDEYDYAVHKMHFERKRHARDSLLAGMQLEELERSMETTEHNLEVVRQRLANLTLRAPVRGQLSALDADLGERINAGKRLGRIDVLDEYRIRAEIDEYFIARIQRGQSGTGRHGEEELPLTIRKVYPEVRAGRFAVDLEFDADVPDGLRLGQTVHVRLQLDDLEEVVYVARGGFFQTTGGNWAYVLTEDGAQAARRDIRLGRQNPRVYEVLEGLKPGDRVITSSYANFGEDIDVLVLR